MVNIVYKIYRQKVLKSKNNKDNIEVSASSPNNQKFVKQLIEEGTKILHVPNPANPLKASDGEKAVQ
jgi:predicted peroxiredoxin